MVNEQHAKSSASLNQNTSDFILEIKFKKLRTSYLLNKLIIIMKNIDMNLD